MQPIWKEPLCNRHKQFWFVVNLHLSVSIVYQSFPQMYFHYYYYFDDQMIRLILFRVSYPQLDE